MNAQNPVTIHDIARRANVTIGTVSRVLNAKDGSISISKGTCQRVRDIAAELNYVPNKLANQLRKGQTNLLSLILPWNIPEIMDVAELTAKKYGFRLMVQFTFSPDVNVEKQSLMAAMEYRMDGVVWMPTPQTDRCQCREVLRKFQTRHIPIILLEAQRKVFPDNMIVDFDYEDGYRQAVEHLVTNGYRRLYYLSHPTDVRIPFFEQACVRSGVEGCIFYIKSSEELVQILRNNKEPVAVIGENDTEVLVALRVIQDLNKDIPGEVGILNIGDVLISNRFRLGDVTSPRMTSLVRPFGEMARRAIELLIQMKKTPLVTGNHYESLPMSLCVRESTVR